LKIRQESVLEGNWEEDFMIWTKTCSKGGDESWEVEKDKACFSDWCITN